MYVAGRERLQVLVQLIGEGLEDVVLGEVDPDAGVRAVGEGGEVVGGEGVNGVGVGGGWG